MENHFVTAYFFDNICSRNTTVMHNKTLPQVLQKSVFYFFITFIFSAAAQGDTNTVIAKSGDGIFSLLRKSGMDAIKYYEPFLLLNQENIKNGSELIVGKKYILPAAPDSFKAMGTRIVVDENLEQPIFDEACLSLMKKKDSSLRDAVYYFVYSGNKGSKERFEKIMATLSQSLMEKGARVYILEEGSPLDSVDSKIIKSRYGDYSSVINRKYLIHRGSYQRVIVLEDSNFGKLENLVVQIAHSEDSREGVQLTNSLNRILNKNSGVSNKVKNEAIAFKDEESLFFANNLMPPVIILRWVKSSKAPNNGFDLKAEKKSLATMLDDGILEDYSQLNLEN